MTTVIAMIAAAVMLAIPALTWIIVCRVLRSELCRRKERARERLEPLEHYLRDLSGGNS